MKKYTVLRVSSKGRDLLKELAKIKEVPMTILIKQLAEKELKAVKGE